MPALVPLRPTIGRSAWPTLALAAGLVGGLGLLYAPMLRQLARQYWPLPEFSHGPLVLAVALGLLASTAWLSRASAGGTPRPWRWAGWVLLGLGLLLNAAGNVLAVVQFGVVSLAAVLAGTALLLGGPALVRAQWFGYFFLLFLVPWPTWLSDPLTQPMKIGVSWAAEQLLHGLGYPVARTGVMLDVGPYRLMVADACAGLNALFMLEAFGLLYLHLLRHTSALRNAVLGLLIVPISFCANVLRVLTLALLTLHFGDAVGQGLMHEFSGLVLFAAALLLLAPLDALLRRWVRP